MHFSAQIRHKNFIVFSLEELRWVRIVELLRSKSTISAAPPEQPA